MVKDSPAKTKVTVEDPLVIDELIENSFTNDSFFYEVADKEFYVSDWDIVKVEKLGRFDSMSEQAFKEMQDYVRVIKIKTKDTRVGFEDKYIEKDILLMVEDKALVSKDNPNALSSLELPSNLANGAEKVFTYDNVFGDTPDPIVIHMSKDLMNKPEAFSYALSQQMAELTSIKDALIKHEEGLTKAQMEKVIKDAEEPIYFDMTDEALVDQLYEIMKEDPDSEVAQQFMEQISENACFPAGTRITTDKGLKRIEDIKVGDMVLSKHESGMGEQEFKPVVRTVVHHNKPIFELTFAIVKNTIKENSLSDKKILNLSSKGEVYTIRATPNHPFWVKGQGWTSLDRLEKGQLLEMKESNTQAYVIFVSPQYQTNYSNIVATYGFENEIIFDEQSINNLSAKYELEQYDEKGDRKFLSTKEIEGIKLTVKDIGEVYVSNNIRLDTVYNFEVADNHTYYIGDFLWVHNDNCPVTTDADVKTWSGSPVPNLPIFHSLKEANDFFKSLPEDSDLLVPAIVRVGRVKVNSVTKGKINAVDFEHGSRNAI